MRPHHFPWLLSSCMLLSLGAAPSPRVEQVIVVFKTHFDIGYTDLASNVVQRYRTTMIDQALAVVDQNRDLPPDQQFAWTIPGWPMHKITEDWPGQTPQRKQRIMQAFKSGRFVVHALPFTTHTELLELEDLVRGLDFSARLHRSAGLPLPRDAKMTDVPSHSWAIATILKHAGVDFLHLGCNAASSSPRVPPLFFWEGPDGSRLLTMYTAESYGTGLVPPADWPHKTWLALIHTGDNHGPPTPDEVKKLLAEAATKLPNVKIKIGRLSDFADAILAEKPTLPIIRGDMPDTWIHGPMSDPDGASKAHFFRPLITATESLNALLKLWNIDTPDISPSIATAYENSLLYGEHTWGGALYWVTDYAPGKVKFPYGDAFKSDLATGRFKRLEESWEEHTSYIEKALDIILPRCATGRMLLAKSVNTDGLRIVVYNPLPWKLTELVAVLLDKPTTITALRAIDDPTPITVHNSGTAVEFIATDIPPMGYRTFVATTEKPQAPALRADVASNTIENEFFKLVLDPERGTIKSLIDKRSERELVDTSSPYGLGQYLYERFDANQVADYVKSYVKIKADWATNELGKPPMPPAAQVPYRAVSPRNFKLTIDQNPNYIKADLVAPEQAGLPSVQTSIRLYANLPCVDIDVAFTDKSADSWPEAGWLCFPFKVDQPKFHLARLGSIIDPATDIVPGSNRHILALNGGLAITDPAGRGVGICSPNSPLISLDAPGLWKYSLDFIPKKPVVFVNLFNNQWTTNFRMWNSGIIAGGVRLWSIDRYNPESSLMTPSAETRFATALSAAAFSGPPGHLPPTQSGLSLSRKGVLVTAFAPSPHAPGTLLRLWELAGQSGPCRVRLPQALNARSAQPVNLRGQPTGQPIPVAADSFEFALPPFAPATFILRPD